MRCVVVWGSRIQFLRVCRAAVLFIAVLSMNITTPEGEQRPVRCSTVFCRRRRRRGGFHLRCVASPKRKEEGSSHLVPPRPSSFDCRVAAAVHPPIFLSSFYFLPPNYAVRSEVVRLKAAPLKLHRLRIAVRGSGVLATNPPQEDSRELKFRRVSFNIPVSHCQET